MHAQYIYDLTESHGIDRAKGVATMVLHNLQDAGAAEALERLRGAVLAADLGDVEYMPNLSHYLRRESEKILLALPIHPSGFICPPSPARRTGFSLGEYICFDLCQ